MPYARPPKMLLYLSKLHFRGIQGRDSKLQESNRQMN